MPTVHVDDRSIITVEGEDAETFLQNIITTDLSLLPEGEARPSALLSPQGKILFDFLISRDGDDRFLLDIRVALADDFVRRLTMYKLRAKATISKQDQAFVAVSWGDDSALSHIDSGVRDTRFPLALDVRRFHKLPLPAATAHENAWSAQRIESGVAESGLDYTAGDAFPHDVLLDENGGVGFKKGCYIGQEVVSRMQHRGTARRRVMIASGPLAAPGTEIVAGGKPIGTLGTVVAGTGLAIVRIDRVKDAIDNGTPITAYGVRIDLRIPPTAKYRFPETATEEG
jgi:folate-binding protein YgfZ